MVLLKPSGENGLDAVLTNGNYFELVVLVNTIAHSENCLVLLGLILSLTLFAVLLIVRCLEYFLHSVQETEDYVFLLHRIDAIRLFLQDRKLDHGQFQFLDY